MIATYAQGFAQLRVASEALGFGLKLERVAAVWRGGCIIRADLLETIRGAFSARPDLPNLLADPALAGALADRRADLGRAAVAAVLEGIPAPSILAAVGYVDALRAPWLPANLIQAQRDYFGAHTYHRVDEPGVFHTEWV